MSSRLRRALPRTDRGHGPISERIASPLPRAAARWAPISRRRVYQALAESPTFIPDWVAGISIGAINCRPDRRQPAGAASRTPARLLGDRDPAAARRAVSQHRSTSRTTMQRQMINQFRATGAMLWGAPNFFKPRIPPPIFHAGGQPGNLAFYDISPLKALLEAPGRFRPHQRPGDAASASAPPTSRPATSPTSTT